MCLRGSTNVCDKRMGMGGYGSVPGMVGVHGRCA